MAINYPGPFTLRIFYTTTFSGVAIQHMMELNIDLTDNNPTPGTLFVDLDVEQRDLTSEPLDTYVTSWVNLLKPLWSSGGGNTFDYVELWKYTPLTFDATFVSSMALAIAGTSGSTTKAGAQDIWTWRTAGGGIMKFSFMETVQDVGIVDTPPLASAALIAIYDHVLSGNNAFLARDGTMPFALIGRYPGTNESSFRQRYRP